MVKSSRPMQPTEIAASYDAIAHQWLAPHLDTNGLRAHEHALTFRPDGGRALDVGCGCHGRFLRLLASRGYEAEGLDVSARMISLAQERTPGVMFHQADVCEWEPAGRYDFITAWDSIWHVPLERHEGVLKKLCAALNPRGVFIWSAGGLDGPDEKHDSSMGPPVYYSTPGIPRMLQIISETGCVCRHLEYDQRPENHIFLIAQKT